MPREVIVLIFDQVIYSLTALDGIRLFLNKVKMKKLLIITALFVGTANAGEIGWPGVTFYRNSAVCTESQFKQEVTDFQYLKNYEITGLNDNSATIEKYSFRDVYNYWLTNLRLYNPESTSVTVKERRAYYKNQLNIAVSHFYEYIQLNFQCAKQTGMGLDFKTVFTGMSPYNATIDSRLGYNAFEAAYPKKTNTPVIFLIDSLLNRDFIIDAHYPRMITGKSYVNGEVSPISSTMTGITATHGNAMAFDMLMVSDANVRLTAIPDLGSTGIYTPYIPEAINNAVLTKTDTNTPVLNLSFSAAPGNESENTIQGIKAAYNSGIPVVQSAGNSEVFVDNMPYLKERIVVGFTLLGQMRSNYGESGPDLLVEEEGFAPIPIKSGQYKNEVFVNAYASSGATALVSGIVSRMRNTCPKSTPDEIKDTLITTATKYTGQHAVFVKGGYVNPKAALDKLKTLPSCKPTVELGWQGFTTYYAKDDAKNVGFISAFSKYCVPTSEKMLFNEPNGTTSCRNIEIIDGVNYPGRYNLLWLERECEPEPSSICYYR